MISDQHIVVGIDFSHASGCALNEAIRFSHSSGIDLTAVHVIDEDFLLRLTLAYGLEKASILKEAQLQMEVWVAEQTGGLVTVECEIVVGSPLVQLLEACYRHKADLLVLGTHGINGKEGHTGAIASACVRQASVKVMLVNDYQDKPFRRVAACIDFSPTSALVLKEAAKAARAFGARLTLIHVIRPLGEMMEENVVFAPRAIPYDEKVWRDQVDAEFRSFLANHHHDLDGLSVEHRMVESAVPELGISSFVNEHEIDLLVLASRGRTGLNRILLGTTAEKILRRTPCSTLVVKPADFQAPLGV